MAENRHQEYERVRLLLLLADDPFVRSIHGASLEILVEVDFAQFLVDIENLRGSINGLELLADGEHLPFIANVRELVDTELREVIDHVQFECMMMRFFLQEYQSEDHDDAGRLEVMREIDEVYMRYSARDNHLGTARHLIDFLHQHVLGN